MHKTVKESFLIPLCYLCDRSDFQLANQIHSILTHILSRPTLHRTRNVLKDSYHHAQQNGIDSQIRNRDRKWIQKSPPG